MGTYKVWISFTISGTYNTCLLYNRSLATQRDIIIFKI